MHADAAIRSTPGRGPCPARLLLAVSVAATPPIVAGARRAHPWGPLLILSHLTIESDLEPSHPAVVVSERCAADDRASPLAVPTRGALARPPTATSPWSSSGSPRPPRWPPAAGSGAATRTAPTAPRSSAMRTLVSTVSMNGVVVIGEGEKDEAPDALQRRARRRRHRRRGATSPSTRSTARR